MPVIHTHVSVSTTPEQREALKAAYGKAITAVPGKSGGLADVPVRRQYADLFGGSDDQPAAYVEVTVRPLRAGLCLGKADREHYGRAELHARHSRGPHLHPLHRHHRLGLEVR